MRRLVKEERAKLYNQAQCHLTLEHPGGEAQVDFGEIYILEQGLMKKAHELVLSFPQSNAGFCQVTRSETMEALCEGLMSIFDYIGVVPNKIWFGQMAAACIRKKDEKGNRSTHWIDFIDIIVTRPQALKYSGFYSLLPENWRMYINALQHDEVKGSLTLPSYLLDRKEYGLCRAGITRKLMQCYCRA